MKGFIEVTDLGGLKQLISTNSILRVYHEEPQIKGSMSTMATKELTCIYEQASYSQTLVFKESCEEIKQLIKEATQESDQDFLDKCAIELLPHLHSQATQLYLNRKIEEITSIPELCDDAYYIAKSMLKARKEALGEKHKSL